MKKAIHILVSQLITQKARRRNLNNWRQIYGQ
jgi:hypothetical protein